MPSFLNITSAAIAAAAAVPLLLLLYFLKLRRREMDVPSTLLWKKAVQDLQVNAPFQRLRRNLLLLLQMLILLALLLALARPVVNYTPGAGKLSVILIDRSASMSAITSDGSTRLEQAKRHAKELLDTMGRDSEAMVIAFDDSARVVHSKTSDRPALKRALDSIQGTDRPSRLKWAYQLAEAEAAAFLTDVSARATQRPEVFLFSDGRVLDAAEVVLKQAELKRYFAIGSADDPNVAIVALSAKRNYQRPAEVQIFVRLANFGPEPATVALQLSVDGQVPAGGVRSGLVLLPERWTSQQRDSAIRDQKLFPRDSAEFTLELLGSAVVRAELKELAQDALLADNSAQVIVPPPRSLNVLLVSSRGNFWLQKFLDSANLKDPRTITAAEYEKQIQDPQAVAAAYDIILFDRYSPATLPPAGNFLYFAAVPPDHPIRAATDAAGVQIVLRDQELIDWDRSHPILRGLNLRFMAEKMFRLTVPLDGQVLIDGADGPMLVFHRDGRRAHMVFAFDVNDTGWPLTASFPVFMDNALQYLALGSQMSVRESYSPGATPRIPRFNLQQAAPDLRRIVISGPSSFGTVAATIEPTGDFALPPLDKVGVYSLDPPIPQFEKLAVNLLDENESNLIPADSVPGGGGAAVAAAVSGRSRLELWWWLVAVAAVPLCLLEWWVYTRRVHL
jgi:hypothetical protein